MLTIVFALLSSLLAAANLFGAVSAVRRNRRGDDRGYSSVPLLSLLFAIAAWFAGPEPFGIWVFLPTAFDPGTWSVLLLPWFALTDKPPSGSLSQQPPTSAPPHPARDRTRR